MSLTIRSKRGRKGATSKSFGVMRKATTWAGTLLLIFVLVGLVYTWWIGKQTQVEVPDVPVSRPISKAPSVIQDDSQVGVALQSLTTPVKPGENVAMMVKTNPKAACSILVTYNNDQPSADKGLVPKTADEYGTVSWSWKVEENRLPGTWPATVTCANATNSGVYVGKFVVEGP